MPRLVERYCIHLIQLLRGPIGTAGVGTDSYGEPLEGATPSALSLNARVEFDNHRVTDMKGEEIVCVARIFIPPTYPDPDTGVETDLTIGGQDRIMFEGRTYAIARTDRQEGWLGDRGRHWDVSVH